MMVPFSVNVRGALIYLFVLVLIYLAGIYVNPIYYYLYVFMFLFPFVSIAQVVLALLSLRYLQRFDTEHPVKGGFIGYHILLRGSRTFATGGVFVRFKPIHPRLPDRIEDISLTFGGRNAVEKAYKIQCRYRGTYTVGIETLQIRDVLGWLTVRRPAGYRTFYVYPRIVDVDPPPVVGRVGAIAEAGSGGSERDFSLLEGLEDYRAGSSIKHVAWKKYLATGVPYLKQFGSSAQPGVSLYIDLRQRGFESSIELETEDCTVEIAVALVKAYLQAGVPVTVLAQGEVPFRFHGQTPSDFQEFYRTSADLIFHPNAVSPAHVRAANRHDSLTGGSEIVLTHLADPEVLELLPGGTGVILNMTALDDSTKRRVAAMRDEAGDEGGTLYLVRHGDTLREDALEWRKRFF